MEHKNIKIISRKYDGKIHRTWSAELLDKQDQILELVGVFEDEIRHEHLGVIRGKTVSYEFYWLDRWFNVFRFHEPDGNFRNFYCNINTPPVFSENELDYVDLDIDILVRHDFSYQILDLDEFETNSQKYNYPNHIIENVNKSVTALISMIEAKTFPFDYKK